MFRPYEIFIALRYARAGRKRGFVSLITLISILGLAVGVTALLVVLSVMNGFERELRERILGMVAHATVYVREEAMSDWREVADRLLRHPEIVGVAPLLNGEGMLIHGRQVQGVLVRGIEPEWERGVSFVDRKIVAGALADLQPGEFGIVLGRALAESLRVAPGDMVTLATPELRFGVTGVLPRLRRFRVVGVFDAGMYEFDSSLALIHLEDARRLYRRQGVGGLNVLTTDLMSAPVTTRRILQAFPESYFVVDWTQRHVSFFRALRTEKTVMFVILMLIVAVAVFNIVAMLMIAVTDRQAQIAVLRSMGASRGSILAIFVSQGLCITVLGILLGGLAGVWLALNVESLVQAIEEFFQVRFLSPEIYYISQLPSDLRWGDVLGVGVAAFLLGVVATLYPAWHAATVEPARVLRHE